MLNTNITLLFTLESRLGPKSTFPFLATFHTWTWCNFCHGDAWVPQEDTFLTNSYMLKSNTMLLFIHDTSIMDFWVPDYFPHCQLAVVGNGPGGAHGGVFNHTWDFSDQFIRAEHEYHLQLQIQLQHVHRKAQSCSWDKSGPKIQLDNVPSLHPSAQKMSDMFFLMVDTIKQVWKQQWS